MSRRICLSLLMVFFLALSVFLLRYDINNNVLIGTWMNDAGDTLTFNNISVIEGSIFNNNFITKKYIFNTEESKVIIEDKEYLVGDSYGSPALLGNKTFYKDLALQEEIAVGLLTNNK